MPYKQPGSRYWYIDFTDASGRRVRRSAGTTSRREAEALEAKWRHEVWEERFKGTPPRRRWDDAAKAYLESRPMHPRADYAIAALKPYFGDRILQDLTAEDAAAYRQQREQAGRAPATIIREMGVLSRILSFARRELGWEGIPDITSGRTPRKPPGNLRWLTWEEYDRLLEAARANERAPWLADFIELAVHTGMRKQEILGLEWRRVDLQRRLVYLEPEHTKGRRLDSVPLDDEALAVLQRRKRRGERYVFQHGEEHLQNVKRSFATAVRNAGIAPCRIHDLRHTCGAWLVQSGTPLRMVADVLRHRDITMTMRYSHLAPENVHEAVARLSGYVKTMTDAGPKQARRGRSRHSRSRKKAVSG